MRLSILISYLIWLEASVSGLELVGNYRFWHSISDAMIYDYSGNSRHASLQQFVTNAAYYTDRGLYIQQKCLVSFPNNQYNTFPVYSDIALNFWYYPLSFREQRLVLIGESSKHTKVTLKKLSSNYYKTVLQIQSIDIYSSDSNLTIGNI